MIPLAGVAVLAAVAGVVSQTSVPRVLLNGDAIEVMLPANAFRHEQFLKYLASGLTTAIVVSADDVRAVVRIEIRYDLWDEIYRLTWRDASGKREQLTLLPARLNEWLSTTHFRAASSRDGQAPAFLRIGVDVIPFSASEQADAQRWLLHSIRDAEGSPSSGAPKSSPNEASGAFDRMIAGSVQPKAILSWHWKVPVSRP